MAKHRRDAAPRTRSNAARRGHASVPIDLLIASALKAQQTGDAERAEAMFRQTLASDPTEPRAVQYLGAMLSDRDEIDAAIDLFEGALERVGDPSASTLGFYNNYANVLRRARRFGTAEKILRDLVAAAPREWQPWHNLGQTLRDLERFDEAAAALRRAVMLEPDFGPNHGVLGETLFQLGRLHSAQAALQRCLDLGWRSDPNTWTTIGANERLLGRLDDALETLEHAIALSGSTPGAHSNLGVVLTQLGRFDEASAHFDQVLELDPDNDTMHAYRGYVLLAAGRISEAWDEWDHGIKGGPRGKERQTNVPRWTREDKDSRVLVYREQGVGDELMLASCYPDIIAAAQEVIIECDPRLEALFARSFPEAVVRARSVDILGRETLHDYDRSIPAGSLARIFRRNLDEFPDERVIVKADPVKVAEWRERLREVGDGPYVGLSWRSKVKTAERRLEYTRLEEWGEIFDIPNVTWVNLQYDDCEHELHDAEERFGVRVHRWDFLDLMNDLDEVAALNSALDLVIAPRNAVSMLSGALGVETIALANRFSWADLGTDRLPWLPAARMIYREPNGEWAPALTALARAVAEVADRTTSRV
jgi:tetratricopeptide (TPR) repeat protein